LLERFKVPDEIAVRVSYEDMRSTMQALFSALGMPQADAERCAEVLTYADVRGIDSHGVSNMTRAYVAGLQQGRINPRPEPRTLRDDGSAIVIDGDKGLGLGLGLPAMQRAIDRARRQGVGVALVANAGHYGAAAYYAHQALAHDMIGVSMTTGGVLVAPTFGAERLLGLNPIAVAAPSDRETPFIFDASMSAVAANKIALLKRVGGQVAAGWVTQADGLPVMEESPVPEGFMMLPLGGTRELGSHKGFGLIMLVEVLTTLLAGGGGGPFRRSESVHLFAAFDVAWFTDVARFKADMDEYLRRLLECRPAPGCERVVYPGVEEAEAEADRRANGIPYHPDVLAWLRTTCDQLGARHSL
jgi:LDH2 family malate/lactate/ureidoglycolate dehydrogenase